MITALYQRVQETPKHYALAINGEKETYRSLWNKANINARALAEKGLSQGSIIALHLEKSNDFVVMQIACWLAGYAFMPLPPDWPAQRKMDILKRSQCSCIVSEKPFLYKDLPQHHVCAQVSEDRHSEKFSVPQENHAQDTAYLVFTSGSSGTPKGVVVSFAGLLHVITEQIEYTQLRSGENALWLHHTGFDASIADVWVSLLAGACLYADTQLSPQKILDFVNTYSIHYIDLPSPLLPLLDTAYAPLHLKTLLVGGEISNYEALKQWTNHCRIVIAYGPTEVSICTSMHVFTPQDPTGLIGQPLKHLEYILLDEHKRPITTETSGELMILGNGVAKGYIENNTSSARFTSFQGKPAYCTGDIVKKTHENYQFIGRIDRQFKHRGKLVCPEEIEHILKFHEKVTEAYTFQYNGTIIIALVSQTPESRLKEALKAYLPEWMCPQRWLFFDKLPRNHNQKINRQHIVEQLNQEAIHYNTETPELSIIRKTLKNPNITEKDTLTHFSPDSLQYLEIIAKLNQLGYSINLCQLQEKIKLKDFFSKNTKSIHKISNNEISDNNVPHEKLIQKDRISSAVLNKALDNLPSIKTSHQHEYRENNKLHKSVLLTGATGKLGGEILKHLAKTGYAVFCLIRGGETRLNALIHHHKLEKTAYKFTAIDGDISEPQFGLSNTQWQNLCECIQEIYHCAADTSLLKNWQELFDTNVKGCYHLLQLAASGREKQLNYASTLALIVDSEMRSEKVDENTPLDNTIFYGGYAQSKWQCEYLIKQSQTQVNIFRFGLLIAQPSTPLTDTTSSTRDWFEEQIIKIPDLSQLSPKASIDFTPLEFAAEAMFKISEASSSGVFHIHTPKPLKAHRLNTFLIEISQQLYSENSLPAQEVWQEDSLSPLRLFKMTNTRIQSHLTQEKLKQLGITPPSISDTQLKTYLEKLCTRTL